jgi:hypothetical protein
MISSWDGGKKECGCGLHFCAQPLAAANYYSNATRYIACPVALADMALVDKPEYPDKIKARGCCGPVWECNLDGERIKEATP